MSLNSLPFPLDKKTNSQRGGLDRKQHRNLCQGQFIVWGITLTQAIAASSSFAQGKEEIDGKQLLRISTVTVYFKADARAVRERLAI